jgi:hypothetical protein
MIKTIITPIISCIFCILCNCGGYYHEPGGPYYFQSAITYQGIRPNKEITQDKTKALADSGYAFYVAYFNNKGKPTIVEKHYEGKLFNKSELIYENDKLIKTIFTDKTGNQKILTNQ